MKNIDFSYYRNILSLLFLCLSISTSATAGPSFTKYTKCYIGAEVEIKRYLDWYPLSSKGDYYNQYCTGFFKKYDGERVSKPIKNGKAFCEEYDGKIYTIIDIQEYSYDNDANYLITLSHNDELLYYLDYIKFDKRFKVKTIDCPQYKEDLQKEIDSLLEEKYQAVERSVLKKENIYDGYITYTLHCNLDNMSVIVSRETFKSAHIVKMVYDTITIYSVSFRMRHLNYNPIPSGINILFNNHEHIKNYDISNSVDVVKLLNKYVYDYTSTLILSESEYSKFCDNLILSVRLNQDDALDEKFGKERGKWLQYCFQTIRNKQ